MQPAARLISGFAVVILFVAALADAQWAKTLPANLPRKADGTRDLSAPAGRTRDGKPDLSGLWETYSEGRDMPRLLINFAAGLKAEDLDIQPWAQAILRERIATNSKDHPGVRCLPSGVPEKNVVPAPFKIVQTADLIVILYESRTVFRQVLLDGRQPVPDAVPTWQGYSVGRWDSDALVIETRGFHDKGWLDMMGHPASDALHVTERVTRPDVGHLDIAVTIDDAKAYGKTWGATIHAHLMPDDELMEHICEENEKDAAHVKNN
jgi:hypothetical protein